MGEIISSYSLVTTIVLYNLALILIYFLRRKKSFMALCGTEVMLFITLLAVIRLLSPIDFPRAYIVRSENLAPAVKNVLNLSPFSSFPSVNLGKLTVCIWLTGTCWFVGKYASELHRAMRLRKAYVSVSNEEAEQAIKKLSVKYPVVISGQVSSPHTAGFFRPVIYLPEIELSQDKWEYILKHEVQHIKAHDIWIKLFYAILETVMWWNPVSHLFMRELDALLELRCDALVTIELTESERVDYLTTIRTMLKKASADSSEMVSAHFASDEDYIRERFRLVLDMGKRKDRRTKYAVCAAALVIFFLSYFVVIQPAYRPSFDEAAGMSTNYENVIIDQFILFDGEKYALFVDNVFSKNLSVTDLAQEPYNTLPIYNSGGN